MPAGFCEIPGCGPTDRLIRGMWCNKHYFRWRTHGHPLLTREGFPNDLLFKTEQRDDGCILHTNKPDWYGYPKVTYEGRTTSAHLAVWKHFVGPLRQGYQIDHICHDPDVCTAGDKCLHRRCVNISHLKMVPALENSMRSNSPSALNSRKTHCKRGHPFDEENTYLIPSGGRACRACSRLHELGLIR